MDEDQKKASAAMVVEVIISNTWVNKVSSRIAEISGLNSHSSNLDSFQLVLVSQDQ